MEENGARLNRRLLADAYLLACALDARSEPEVQAQSRIRPRAGAIQQAVIQALAAADRRGDPLRQGDAVRVLGIHRPGQGLGAAALDGQHRGLLR